MIRMYFIGGPLDAVLRVDEGSAGPDSQRVYGKNHRVIATYRLLVPFERLPNGSEFCVYVLDEESP